MNSCFFKSFFLALLFSYAFTFTLHANSDCDAIHPNAVKYVTYFPFGVNYVLCDGSTRVGSPGPLCCPEDDEQ